MYAPETVRADHTVQLLRGLGVEHLKPESRPDVFLEKLRLQKYTTSLTTDYGFEQMEDFLLLTTIEAERIGTELRMNMAES